MSKIIGNTVGTPNPRPDWNQTDETKANYIKNKPEAATVISEKSTDEQYSTAKAVYTAISEESNYANDNFANAIKGNASGSFIKVDDVSPIEHNLSVKVDKPNVTVSRYGKNLFPSFDSLVGTKKNEVTLSKVDDYYVLHGTATGSANFTIGKIHFDAGTYTISANNTATVGSGNALVQIYSYSYPKNDSLLAPDNQIDSFKTITIPTASDYECRIKITKGMDYNNFKIKPQLEVGTVATEHEPYKGVQTAVSNEDGVIEGLSSTSPNMILTASDTDNIQLEYNKDTIKHIEDVTKITAKLRGKKIVNFGDSIFGKYRDTNEEDKSISTMISEQTGAKCYNAGFGGCLMTRIDNDWDAFSMHSLADSINSGSWQVQEDALANGANIPAYFSETVNMLKDIDWNAIDMITIAYGVNDYTGNKFIEDTDGAFVNEYDYYKGALRYSIKQILKAYPHIKIAVITPLWKWNRKVDGSFDYSSDDIDKSQNTRGYTLIDYVNACIDVSNEFHISCIDNYNLGINEYNYLEYFNSNDGTHPNRNGRQLCADNIVSKILTNDSEKSINFEKISSNIKEEIDKVRTEISAIGDRVDELIDAEILSASSFVNGAFEEGKGIVASDYWIIMKKSIPVKIGDKITIKPNGLKVWWRIHNSDDLSVAVNVSQDAHKVITEDFEYTSEYDGWFNAQIGRVDGQRITPSDYVCDIKVGTSIFEKIENLENNISQKQDELKDGENIKTINGESILGSGNITIDGGEETSTSSGTLFSKHTPFTHIIDDCQDATNWTINNQNGLDPITVEDHIIGSQKSTEDIEDSKIAKLYSLHCNNNMLFKNMDTCDLTDAYIVIKVRVNSIGDKTQLILRLGNEVTTGKAYYEIGRQSNWTTPEGWQEIIISSNNYSYCSSTPMDFSKINEIYICASPMQQGITPSADWNLQYVGTRPKATNKGIVTFTFDDGWDSQYTGVKLLAEKGITSTIFTIKEAVESGNYLTLDNLKSLVTLYNTDIEVHGDPAYIYAKDEAIYQNVVNAWKNSNPNKEYPFWTDDSLKSHWSSSQKWIKENGLGEGNHLAYPNGVFPEHVVELAKNYFDSCRTIIPFMPIETLPVADRYRIRAVSGVGSNNSSANVEKIKGYLDRMAKDGGWLILVLHKIGDALGDTMYCSEEDLSAIADYAIDSGVDIMNYAEVMERFYADLSPEKDTTVSGEDIVIPENVETTDNKVSTIEDNVAEDKYPTVSAVRDYINKYKHIIPITEDTFIFELEDGIYYIDGDSGATIYFDEGGEGFQDGLLLVRYIEDSNSYSWTAIGRDTGWFEGVCIGYTELIEEAWVASYSLAETESNRVNIINDITNNNAYYPTVKAVTEYVEEAISTKQDTLVSGGNIKTINGQSILGAGNIKIESVVNGDGSPVVENSAFETLPLGKNLLNRETDTVGYNLTETGELASNGNYEVTDFIPVVENESYHLSKNGVGTSARTICFYDTHKNVLSFASNTVVGQKFIAPENAKYVRFSFTKSATEVQFEQSEVVTPYEAFVSKKQIGYNELYIPKRAIPSEALKCMTKKAGGKNLLDRTVSEVGKVITETGELGNASTNETSDFIPVAFGDNLYISGVPESGYETVLSAYAIYDENKQIIKVVHRAGTYGENPLPIPRHARFVRYSYRKAGTNIQIERGMEATEYEEYIGVPALDNELIGVKMPNDLPYSLNPWSGKRLVVDGDSITHDQGSYNYWQFIASKLTDMYIDNTDTTTQYANGWKGVGGSRIANDPVESTDDPKYSIVLRYQNLPDDADLVIIAGGTNDWQHGNVDLGDFDSTDVHTFNGALNTLLPGLKLKYKYIPVVMMTPIKRGTEYNKPNKKGLTQEQFVDAMIAKCRQYGIYCLDMYSNCPLNPQIPELNELFFLPSKNSDGSIRYDEQGNIMYDATHPNTEGHKIMGRTVAGFIRTLS